jgi:DNA-binding beta-propeller fold protein YncE
VIYSLLSRVATCCVVLGFATLSLAGPLDSHYHLLKKYPFPAAPESTREYFDYINVDSAARRVYLSHGTEIKVIDADNGGLVGNIGAFKQSHGVALAPEFGHGFVSDGAQGKVFIFDLKTLKITGEVKADPDTDCIIYDPASKNVFAMNGDGHSSTVIDASSGTVVKTIGLGGAPEFAVADGQGMVYVSLADKNVLAAIDTRVLEIKARFPVAPAGGPTALAIDPEHGRLFSSGRGPQQLVVMDAENGKVITSFPISAGVDASAYDRASGLIFASTRDGLIHIFHEDSPDKYSVVETVKTEYGAKTMGLDSTTHNLFLDTAEFGPVPPATTAQPHPRPTAILGTFHVLVYGR